MSDEEEEERNDEVEKKFSELETCLAKSVSSFQDDPGGFRDKGIFQMGAFIRIFADIMKMLDVPVKEDVLSEDKLGQRLGRLFSDWDRFLERVDVQV